MPQTEFLKLIAFMCGFGTSAPTNAKMECMEIVVNCAIVSDGAIVPRKDVEKCYDKYLRRKEAI